MGRNFSPTTDSISLGDITTARFSRNVAWSLLSFFRIENFSGDDRTIVGKWNSGKQQFIVRTLIQASGPAALEVYHNGSRRCDTGLSVALNTWYVVRVVCDGVGNLQADVVGMNGSLVTFDGGTTPSDAADLTEPITIGNRAGPNDPMDGDVAYVCYAEKNTSLDEVRSYVNDAVRTVLRWKSEGVNIRFFLPLGLGSPDHDWSGNGNTGTVTGTAVGDNPPIVPFRISSHVPQQVQLAQGARRSAITSTRSVQIPIHQLSI